MSKINDNGVVRDMTAEEQAQYDADLVAMANEKTEKDNAETQLTNLKASAKAKLIAGEALTEDEANTIVL